MKKKRKPGGQPIKRSTSKAQRVAELCAAGWNLDAIALAMGIDKGTLEQKYARSLSSGAMKVRAELTQELIRLGKKGHVSAARKTLSGNTPKVEERTEIPGMPAERIEAFTAAVGTDWEDRLPDHRKLLSDEQRMVVDAAIDKKREELKR